MSGITGTVRVTVLVDDTSGGPGLPGEHGLALWVEAGPVRVLFDTGQGAVIEGNARRLGIPLKAADAVVLSHGHYDHTGGLGHVLDAAPRARVFAHPAAFQPKYARRGGRAARSIGMSSSSDGKVRRRPDGLIWTEGPTFICDGLAVTGEIPRVTAFEDTGGPFFLDAKCRRIDPLIDDQAMFVESSQGTVVLLGCAHAGVINTLRYIQRLTDGRLIHAVVGGMHLVNASSQRRRRTIESLAKFRIQHLLPAHCTGRAAVAELRAAFQERSRPCVVGSTMEFGQ